jgi:hypothetical protein
MRRKPSRPDRTYLLRCWQDEQAPSGEEPRWRFSVEEVLQKRPRQGFESLEALFAFLRADLSDGGDEPPDEHVDIFSAAR